MTLHLVWVIQELQLEAGAWLKYHLVLVIYGMTWFLRYPSVLKMDSHNEGSRYTCQNAFWHKYVFMRHSSLLLLPLWRSASSNFHLPFDSCYRLSIDGFGVFSSWFINFNSQFFLNPFFPYFSKGD